MFISLLYKITINKTKNKCKHQQLEHKQNIQKTIIIYFAIKLTVEIFDLPSRLHLQQNYLTQNRKNNLQDVLNLKLIIDKFSLCTKYTVGLWFLKTKTKNGINKKKLSINLRILGNCSHLVKTSKTIFYDVK